MIVKIFYTHIPCVSLSRAYLLIAQTKEPKKLTKLPFRAHMQLDHLTVYQSIPDV
uniref:Uncharacterized protein n=1 Tax=Arundo donax TaxID=35708 RepID=A0A0A9GT52_ARUDO